MKDFDSLYFVGAGGIGMAALERYFLAKGKRVAGYDRTPSDLTRELEQEGVHIDYDENPDLIPDYCRDPQRTLVVYTPAVPDTHQGLTYFRSGGFEVVKRAALLWDVRQQWMSRIDYINAHQDQDVVVVHQIDVPPIADELPDWWLYNCVTWNTDVLAWGSDLEPREEGSHNLMYAQYYGWKKVITDGEDRRQTE